MGSYGDLLRDWRQCEGNEADKTKVYFGVNPEKTYWYSGVKGIESIKYNAYACHFSESLSDLWREKEMEKKQL